MIKAFVRRGIEAFWNAGQQGFASHDVVRIRAINVATLIIALAMSALIAVMLASDGPGWNQSAWINIWLLLALLPVLVAHWLGFMAKALLFFAWIALFVVVEASFGRINATHIALLVMPAIAVYVLGVKRWALAVAVSALYTLLFLTIEYLVPWTVGWHETFLGAVAREMPDFAAFGLYDLIFVTVVIVTEVTVFMGAFLTLSALRKAQDALAREYARSELLLANMLPAAIADRLKSNPTETIADSYGDVTILFADLVGFTAYSSSRPAEEVVETLTTLFNRFDALVAEYQLEKIKTVGDAYMVAGGLDTTVQDHPKKIAALALRMIDATESLFRETQTAMSLRIGVHRGPAVAGVVGNKRTFFDVWGDTVNVASRMEETAPPGCVQVTRELVSVLRDEFQVERGEDVTVKGKGRMERYLVRAKA
ncbi:MAG: adenylate/guanylate cyclase domain-containing protein [Pseudomonadota bacterium]